MKKLLKLLPVAFIALAASCGGSSDDKSNDGTRDSVVVKDSIVLEKVWNTDTTLITAESVISHPEQNLIFVSNIGAVPPDAKDGDGYLSKLDKEGNVLEKEWVTGLNGPKGLAISGGYLYVTDITDFVKIEIETGKIVQKFVVDTAKFLNDAAAVNDEIYFTDSGTGSIYTLKNDSVKLFTNLEGKNTNGVFIEENRILTLTFNTGELIAIDKNTKETSVLASGFGGGDGIVAIEKGYIVSNWNGEIFFVENSENAESTLILDTKEAKVNAADIGLIADKNILLVPTFFANNVVAYKIK